MKFRETFTGRFFVTCSKLASNCRVELANSFSKASGARVNKLRVPVSYHPHATQTIRGTLNSSLPAPTDTDRIHRCHRFTRKRKIVRVKLSEKLLPTWNGKKNSLRDEEETRDRQMMMEQIASLPFSVTLAKRTFIFS